jgi:hypothetical protein
MRSSLDRSFSDFHTGAIVVFYFITIFFVAVHFSPISVA